MEATSSLTGYGTSAGTAERDYYSPSQAAELLGVSRASVWRWIRAGHLSASRIGARTTRIKHAELDRFMAERGVSSIAHRAPGQVNESLETSSVLPDSWDAIRPGDHFVQFYDAGEALLDAVTGFVRSGLTAGETAVIIATLDHRVETEKRLEADGLDVAEAREQGRYLALDSQRMLSTFMNDGIPDAVDFEAVIGGVLAQATANGRRARLFGEMVATLAVAGNHDGAVALEELWNELHSRYSFALFCAYPTSAFAGASHSRALGEVCGQHGRVIPSETYTELATSDDRARAVVLWQHEAQALEEALEAERSSRQAAETALRARDEFLAVASHELRTPLTALSGHLQLILRHRERGTPVESERLGRSLETINGQTTRLSHLIDRLLDVSRLDTGKLVLEPVRADLIPIVDHAVSAARMTDGDHPIRVSVPESLEARVDPMRVGQVLTNLLDNAIKYTPGGTPIDVVVARTDPDMAILSVRDHGTGIPVEKRDALFERFYQANHDRSKRGMGLGLYICRQIAELHKGTIRAEFPPDGGTCFVVSLPVGV
ncbi:MAG: ATP-binding protein [Chloroflexota bacterium]